MMSAFSGFVSTAFQILLFGRLVQTTGAAPYLYIDATPSNTTLNGASLVNRNGNTTSGNYFAQVGTDTTTTGTATDGFWTLRNLTGYESGNYFESDNISSSGDAESTAPLVTTINMPTAGTYEIIVIFARSNSRDIAARIDSAPGTGDVFTTSSPLTLNPNQTATADPLFVPFDGSYSNGRTSGSGAAYLGTVTTTVPNQAVQIYINGFVSISGTQDERTQYDGIGYRAYEAKHRDVFLIAGQSNADGRGLKAELTSGLAAYAGQQPSVLIHYTNTAYTNADKSRYKKWITLEPGFSVAPGYTGTLPSTTFGEEIGAAKVLTTQYTNPTFIKVTRGGTALGVSGTDWYPAPLNSPNAGPLYKALIESTQQALAALTSTGDTYTIHALYWHQGESDSTRTAQYSGLLTTLIESVRRDLKIPNLRFIVGELAPGKPQDFRDVQWQIARSVPNAGFMSSSGLTTSDANTHFDTSSMVTFGERLGYALLSNRDTINFEAPIYATGALDRQDECAATNGILSPLLVVATAAQGEYTSGQAAGHVGAAGAYQFTRRNLLPLAGTRTLMADFFSGDTGYDNEADADSSLLVAGWGADAGNDGLFNDAEAAIGLGLNQTGTFRIQIGGTTHLATGFSYQIDRWYRLTLNWSEPDASGQRTIQLFARDLAAGSNVNGGNAVLSIVVSSADFDGNPARWSGLGCRATRGLVDNIRVVPPGFAAWATALYPSLVGGIDDDEDQDGIPNGVEFAFGLNPLSFDSTSQLPQPVYGSTTATLSFNPLSTQPGIQYLVDWSRNLSSWNELVSTSSGNLRQFTVPTAGERSIFIRHRVKITP